MKLVDDAVFREWWYSDGERERRSQCPSYYWEVDRATLAMYFSACDWLRHVFSSAYDDGDNSALDFESHSLSIIRDAPSYIIENGDPDELDVIEKYLLKVREEIRHGFGTEKFTPLDNAYFFNSVFCRTVAPPLKRWLMVANVQGYERVLARFDAILDRNGGDIPRPYKNNKIYKIGDELRFDIDEIQNDDDVVCESDIISSLLFISRAKEKESFDEAESYHDRKIATAAAVMQPQQGVTAGTGEDGRICIGDIADRLLNANAAQYVREYKFRESFVFRCDDVSGVTVNLRKDISNRDTQVVEQLLCGATDADGWCKIERRWNRPSESRCPHVGWLFFSHLEKKKDAGDADCAYWRIAPKAVKIWGGDHGKAGRPKKK